MSRRISRVDMQSLNVLHAIARFGSFSAAAQHLCVVTSSVTHSVKNLEESLGVLLFDRSGRRARFTPEGLDLLEKGTVILDLLQKLNDDLALKSTGWEPRIRIALDQVVRLEAFMPLLDEFFEVAPDVAVEVSQEAVAGTWDSLLSHRSDLIVGAPGHIPTGGGFESVKLADICMVFAVSASHPLSRESGIVSADTLAKHRSVLVGDTAVSIPRLKRGLLGQRDLLSVPGTLAKLQVILRGTACGFLPKSLVRQHTATGELKTLSVDLPYPPSEGLLVWRIGNNGKALRWWRDRLTAPEVAANILF